MAAKNKKPNELHITRLYDAPVKAVWDAWTDPKQVAQWWGPRGFTLTTHKKELRPGGFWRYTMHGPDGTDYENHTVYHEVEKHRRLVYDHGGYEDRPPLFRVTVEFTELGPRQTQMDMTMALPTPEAAQETKKFIKKAGGDSTWDRLAEYLEHESSGREKFVINRVFDAPIETVYAAWTDPQRLSRWLPPAGFTMELRRADFRPGGTAFYMMTDGQAVKMYGRIRYRELRPPGRIVYEQEFCDEKENLSRHPMLPTWPATMLTTVQLTSEGPGQTRVTVSWQAAGQVTAEELKAFVAHKPGMAQGWTGSFDKLEEYLKGAG